MANEDDRTLVAAFAEAHDAPLSRAVAEVPADVTATRPISRGAQAAPPVFVDETGRRGRLLGVLGLGFSLLALLALAALWWSQVAVTSG